MEFRAWIEEQSTQRPVEPIQLASPIPVSDLPTPCLLLDAVELEANLKTMADWSRANGIALRPHSKMHKSPVVAKMQLALGAVGICCAKVSEAAIMQRAGIHNILVTSPVVDPGTAQRVANLAKTNGELMIVVDSLASAGTLEEALTRQEAKVKVLIDIDPGLGRTGIAPGEGLSSLTAYLADECSHLHFEGLQVYAGHCMHIESVLERQEKYKKAMRAGQLAKAQLLSEGYEVKIMSGGGTGSYEFESELGVLDELQAGSYAFMDIEYRDIESKSRSIFDEFKIALTVLVTTISQPKAKTITVDAGFKSLASDKMAPQFKDIEGCKYYWGGDEHGIVALNNPSKDIVLGEKLKLVTPHCDPTVNLHDYYYVVFGDHVKELWPVSTRGCSQ